MYCVNDLLSLTDRNGLELRDTVQDRHLRGTEAVECLILEPNC